MTNEKLTVCHSCLWWLGSSVKESKPWDQESFRCMCIKNFYFNLDFIQLTFNKRTSLHEKGMFSRSKLLCVFVYVGFAPSCVPLRLSLCGHRYGCGSKSLRAWPDLSSNMCDPHVGWNVFFGFTRIQRRGNLAPLDLEQEIIVLCLRKKSI